MKWIKGLKTSDTSYVMVSGKCTTSRRALRDYPYRLYFTMHIAQLFIGNIGNSIYSKKLTYPHPPLEQILKEAEQAILLNSL